MSDQEQPVQFAMLREHDFRSNVPIVGPLIQAIRRGVYGLAAKWGVMAVISQQNQINQQVALQLWEYESRLIDQDRDLAQIARAVAEVEMRQRYLMKHVSSEPGNTESTDATSTSGG